MGRFPNRLSSCTAAFLVGSIQERRVRWQYDEERVSLYDKKRINDTRWVSFGLKKNVGNLWERTTMDRFGSFRNIWAALGAAMVMGNVAMEAVAENPVGGSGGLPPNDRHMPARVEMATFALG